MKKKNGFISMTLVYTFLILFMFLMLAILRTYTEKDKFLQAINDQIDNDIGVAKGSRVTVINRLLEDNMPSSDGNVNYFGIANNYYGNGTGFYYMDKKSYSGYNLESITDENADGHTSKIYYFRGGVENNHIVFAGMCFRILRTNEDGSIRIVYNGPVIDNGAGLKCSTLNNTNFSNVFIGSAQFNTSSSVEYVKVNGFGYVPLADESNEQSPIINALNDWYKQKFVDGFNYTDYISRNTVFCNNKESYETTNYYKSRELAPTLIDPSNLNLYDESNIKSIISFRCENNNDRFSITDGNLLYPVGILTAQDIVLAGGYLDIGDDDQYQGGPNGVIDNTDFYLYSDHSYWTMSPLSKDGKIIYFNGDSGKGVLQGATPTETHYIRPVISLNSNIVISNGNGRADSPYVVRISTN